MRDLAQGNILLHFRPAPHFPCSFPHLYPSSPSSTLHSSLCPPPQALPPHPSSTPPFPNPKALSNWKNPKAQIMLIQLNMSLYDIYKTSLSLSLYKIKKRVIGHPSSGGFSDWSASCTNNLPSVGMNGGELYVNFGHNSCSISLMGQRVTLFDWNWGRRAVSLNKIIEQIPPLSYLTRMTDIITEAQV